MKPYDLDQVLKARAPIFHDARVKVYATWPAALFRVQSGLVQVSALRSDGQTIHRDICGAGDYFGESGLTPPVEECAMALTSVELLRWEFTEVRKYGVELSEMLGRKLAAARQMQDILGAHFIRERLEAALLKLTQYGESSDKGIALPSSITHEILASMVQTSREIITNKLGVLRREGLISQGHGKERRRLVVASAALRAKQKAAA